MKPSSQPNRDRLPPVLMTALALVVGRMSLIVGTRQGAAPNLGIGVFVAPGQSGCWLLTLLAVPSFYSLFQDIAKQITARLAPFRPAARVRK